MSQDSSCKYNHHRSVHRKSARVLPCTRSPQPRSVFPWIQLFPCWSRDVRAAGPARGARCFRFTVGASKPTAFCVSTRAAEEQSPTCGSRFAWVRDVRVISSGSFWGPNGETATRLVSQVLSPRAAAANRRPTRECRSYPKPAPRGSCRRRRRLPQLPLSSAPAVRHAQSTLHSTPPLIPPSRSHSPRVRCCALLPAAASARARTKPAQNPDPARHVVGGRVPGFLPRARVRVSPAAEGEHRPAPARRGEPVSGAASLAAAAAHGPGWGGGARRGWGCREEGREGRRCCARGREAASLAPWRRRGQGIYVVAMRAYTSRSSSSRGSALASSVSLQIIITHAFVLCRSRNGGIPPSARSIVTAPATRRGLPTSPRPRRGRTPPSPVCPS